MPAACATPSKTKKRPTPFPTSSSDNNNGDAPIPCSSSWSNHALSPIGLAKYIASARITTNSHSAVNLSHWPLTDDDLTDLELASASKGIHTLMLRRCIKISDRGLSQLLMKCTQLRHLDLAGCKHLTDATCNLVAEKIPRLRSIDLSGCHQISDRGLCALFRGCKHLEKAMLRNLPRLSDSTVDAARSSIVMYNKLHTIDLSGCTNFTDEALMKMLEDDCCGCIRELDLCACTQLQMGLVGFRRKGNTSTNCRKLGLCQTSLASDSTLNWLAEGCSHLQSLDLSHCRFQDSALSYLFRGCKHLRELNVAGCVDLSDAAWEPLLVSSCSSTSTHAADKFGTRLTSLVLTGCSKITDNAVISIASACPLLQRIDLAGVPLVTCEGMASLARSCPYLNSIDISSDIQAIADNPRSLVPRVGSDGIKALGRHCKHLRILRCNGASRIDACAIGEIARGCPELEVLTLRHCHLVTDECIEAIAVHCSLLRELDIGCCLGISNAAILALSQGRCTQTLESIDFTGLRTLSDTSIIPLVSTCPKLQTLILRGCRHLSDDVVSALCQSDILRTDSGVCIPSRKLDKLDLLGAKGVSDRSLDTLRTYRITLRAADFSGSQISAGALKHFSRHLPNCVLTKEYRFHPRHKRATYGQYKDYLTFVFSQYYKIGSIMLAQRDRQRFINCRAKTIEMQRVFRGFLSRKLAEELRLLARELQEKSKTIHRPNSLCDTSDFSISSSYKEDGGDKSVDIAPLSSSSSVPVPVTGKSTGERHCRSTGDFLSDSSNTLSERKNGGKYKRQRLRAGAAKTPMKHKSSTSTSADRVFAEMRKSWLFYRWRCFSARLVRLERIRTMQKIKAQRCIKKWWIHIRTRLEDERRNQAATTLQTITSSFLRKRRVTQEEERGILMDACARVMQTCWRNRIRWYELMDRVYNDEVLFRTAHNQKLRSAKSIQTHWRFRRAAKISQETAAARDRLELEALATLKLQLCWRIYCAKRITSKRHAIIAQWKVLVQSKIYLYESKAATSIQLRWRHNVWLKKRIKAARVIQNCFRCRKSHLILTLLKMEQREACARKIQGAYRSFRDSRGVFRLWLLYGNHILTIQRSYRSYRRHRAWQQAIRESRIQRQRQQDELKGELLLKKHERKILQLFSKRDDSAASSIQRAYRVYSEKKRANEARLQLQAEAEKVHSIVRQKAERDAEAAKQRKKDRLINALSWCRGGGGGGGRSLWGGRLATSTRVSTTSSSRRMFPITKIPATTNHHFITNVDLRHCEWFDERIAMCQRTYKLNDEDIFELYDAYQDVDHAYGKDGKIYVEYLFDFIDEPMSAYGKWLFSAIDDSSAVELKSGNRHRHDAAPPSVTSTETCGFSMFVHAMCFIGMMGKDEQNHLLFSAAAESRPIDNNSQKDQVKVLTKPRWEALIMAMLEHEPIKYPIPMTVHKFRQYSHSNPANTKERLAFFDDFVRLLETCPFLSFPLDRIREKFQSKFLGLAFWADKRRGSEGPRAGGFD